MAKLDKFEQQIEEELERGEWNRAKDYDRLEEALKEGARSVLKKRPISIRLSERDIMLLKRKSLETGVFPFPIFEPRRYIDSKKAKEG